MWETGLQILNHVGNRWRWNRPMASIDECFKCHRVWVVYRVRKYCRATNHQQPLLTNCYSYGTRRATLVTNPVISHESGKDRKSQCDYDKRQINYLWLFVTQTFRNDKPSNGGRP